MLLWITLPPLALSLFVALVYQRIPRLTRPMTDQSLQFDQFVLFGDSITQQGWSNGGVGAALANAYQRKLDVVNRGLSGYNTAWAIPIAKRWLPRAGGTQPRTAVLMIWFGANDAALPPSPQSLTIPQFKANLHEILQLVTDRTSIYYSPTTKFLLITPPPVDAVVRNLELATRDYPRVPDRDSERTRLFAVAVQEVAAEAGVPCVDTWTAITDAAEGHLERFFTDGLHLNPEGYRIVTESVAKVISSHLPALHWDSLQQTFPHWADIPNVGALGPQFLQKQG